MNQDTSQPSSAYTPSTTNPYHPGEIAQPVNITAVNNATNGMNAIYQVNSVSGGANSPMPSTWPSGSTIDGLGMGLIFMLQAT
jgi:hypothetical protein